MLQQLYQKPEFTLQLHRANVINEKDIEAATGNPVGEGIVFHHLRYNTNKIISSLLIKRAVN